MINRILNINQTYGFFNYFLFFNGHELLVKHGIPIKHRLHEFISIVKPETLLAWNRKMKKAKWTYNNSPKCPGRPKPKKGKETEEIIIKLGTENNWGYRRIQASNRWRRLRGNKLIIKVIEGVQFVDGMEIKKAA